MRSLIPTFSLIPVAFAASEKIDIETAVQSNNFFKYKCIGELVTKGINFALIVGGLAVLILLVWSGIQWLTSGGDKNSVEAAQKRITSTIIGLAILAAAWAIWIIVLDFFGLKADICNPSTI